MAMRSPARAMAGHVLWARGGTVWATWRLHALPYGFRPDKDKHAVRAAHQALLRSLPGEALLLGTCAALDPAAVVERMVRGIPLEHCPEWAAECEATLDTLDELALGQRTFWLSVPLRNSGRLGSLGTSLRAATDDFRDQLALPRGGVPPAELKLRTEQARKIEAGIPGVFRPAPATVAQLVWLYQHALQRGLYADVDLPEGEPDREAPTPPRHGVLWPDALLDEGGQAELDRRQLKSWNPLRRKYLKVTQPDHPEAPSYQALLALADTPADGMIFPGGEYLGRIDDTGLDVDWAVRLHTRSREEVIARNRRAVANLNDQFQQQEGQLSTGMHAIERSARDLAEYEALLSSDDLEVEVEATAVFCVSGRTGDEAMEQARQLQSFYGASGFKLTHPVGNQEDLWWAMLPGTPLTKSVREFAQITTSHSFSAAVPVVTCEIGDNRGSLLALNISTGQVGAVHHDPAGATSRLDVSGSLAIAGELGAGKSVALKKIAADTLDRGGRFIALDRTDSGEWGTMAQALTRPTLVSVADPAMSMDPLRVFDRQTGSRVAQSFLTPLLNIAPTSDRGVLLSDVLDPGYLSRHGIRGLGNLTAHLQESCTLDGAYELGRLMNVFARKDFGRVIFDSSLPPLELDDRAIVFLTRTLELPDREELQHAHLFGQLKLEKIFGRAMYALMASMGRQICFHNRSELSLFIVDEAHHVTASPEGEREITAFVRDGRKHQAAVALGSHDPESDFGDATLRGLIPTRILMRHRDKTLARRGLSWLDLDPDDESLIELVSEHTSPVGADGVAEMRRGEALMRDALGNVARVKIMPPSRPERFEAMKTSPPEVSIAGEAEPPQLEETARP
ncbi:AAA domain-containing protein [Haloactinopolyspora alba]|uniref:AAA domain-containing protein n=1 Tax=Haloactinopolyspora alba TaxID=648780 RepID=A0A2P8DVX1_9ACTN|nr:ATP-binding protein [Haloactinopolyspora alba]PSL01370.1 AAA domain-containing protein [Haloactinopolyspora alba]